MIGTCWGLWWGVAILVAVASLGADVTTLAMKNRDLQAANRRERAATNLAEERFQLALGGIEKYHTGAGDDVLLQQRELSALRESLLRDALEFYKKLEASLVASSHPKSRFALAKAYSSIVGINHVLGDQAQALAPNRKSIAIQEQLVDDHPSERTAENFNEAITHQKKLLQERPSTHSYRGALARRATR